MARQKNVFNKPLVIIGGTLREKKGRKFGRGLPFSDLISLIKESETVALTEY